MKKLYVFMFALPVKNNTKAQWVSQNSGITNNLNSVYFTDAVTVDEVGDIGI